MNAILRSLPTMESGNPIKINWINMTIPKQTTRLVIANDEGKFNKIKIQSKWGMEKRIKSGWKSDNKILAIAMVPNNKNHGRETSPGTHIVVAITPANIKKLSIVLKKYKILVQRSSISSL